VRDAGLRGRAPNAHPMGGRGETLKMFVVQRTFRTVRRGYDPEEVDRHLELVSRWFTTTDAAKALREERARIEERERAAAERSAFAASVVVNQRLTSSRWRSTSSGS